MPRIVARFSTPDGDRYLVWSTIVDAPITMGMELDDLLVWLQEQTDAEWVERFVETRMPRIERCGTSSGETIAELVSCNRAGVGDTELTVEQIVDYYCIRRSQGDKPIGAPHEDG